MFDILIIDKSKKISFMKVMNTDNLYKKIGLKSEEGFLKHCEWNVSVSNYPQLYIHFYGKKIGKANNENKYNFPPPLDKEIFFGKCIVFAYIKNNNEKQYISLSEDLWNNIYLNLTTINEIIIDIPKSKKKILKNDELHLSSSEEDEEEEESSEEDDEDFEDEEVIEDTKEEIIEKIYLNNEIELVEELYLSNSDEDDDTDDDDTDDDDLEYDDDDGDEVEVDLTDDEDNITMKLN